VFVVVLVYFRKRGAGHNVRFHCPVSMSESRRLRGCRHLIGAYEAGLPTSRGCTGKFESRVASVTVSLSREKKEKERNTSTKLLIIRKTGCFDNSFVCFFVYPTYHMTKCNGTCLLIGGIHELLHNGGGDASGIK